MTLSEALFKELEETVCLDSFDDFPRQIEALAEWKSALQACRVTTESNDLAMLLIAPELKSAERDNAHSDEDGGWRRRQDS